MNLIDTTIGWFAPRAALERQRARIALDALRGYDGAQKGRRSASFRKGERSANASVGKALPALRERSRELVRNTFIGARALDVLSTHIVSPDLSVRFDTGSKQLDRQVQTLWNEWVQSCDIEGETSFTGLLTLAVRAELEGGDSLIRMIDRPFGEGRAVPIALQVLEGDLIDESRDASLLTRTADRARLGVQLGEWDQRLGYWLHRQAPGEPWRFDKGRTESILVERAELCHLYRRLRPGQVRGVPVFAPVLIGTRDFADLMDALIVKERMAAAIGMIVKTDASASNMGAAVIDGQSKDRIERIRPGMVEYLRHGEDMVPFTPASNSAFEPVARASLMGISAGIGLTYHQLTGDLSQANYSSLRAGLLEFRRSVADAQWHMLVPQALHRITERWVDRAILAGRLRPRAGGYGRQYVMPAHEPVDPKKDLEADILAVRAGRMSPQDFVEAWGRDWRVVLQEYADFFAQADAAGAIFDIDARQRTRTGQQITDAEQAPEKDPANDET